jgi:hypothetical protein
MCQGEEFYKGKMHLGEMIVIRLGFFSPVLTTCQVCLACGFVAPYVTPEGLARIRQKVGWPWDKAPEKPNKEELREL